MIFYEILRANLIQASKLALSELGKLETGVDDEPKQPAAKRARRWIPATVDNFRRSKQGSKLIHRKSSDCSSCNRKRCLRSQCSIWQGRLSTTGIKLVRDRFLWMSCSKSRITSSMCTSTKYETG